MKVTTEKLPKSLLALEIELDKDQVERGLDKAARRLSQKYPVRGFRPGKAPRAIIERSYGRPALMEEATDDLINKAYRDALDQEKLAPVGPPTLETILSADPFTFRVTFPIAPTITLGSYRDIRTPLDLTEIADADVDSAMDRLRDKHVVLKELDEPRPAQEGDQLKVNLNTIFGDDDEGEIIDAEDAEDEIIDAEDAEDEIIDAEDAEDEDAEDEDADDDEGQEETLDLVPGRLVDELHSALLGLNIGDRAEVTATMPEDHGNESVRGKTVTFKVKVNDIQERILPDWDELSILENVEGGIDGLRAKTRADLEKSVRDAAERKTIDAYIEELVATTEFDIPDVMVHELADELLHEQGHQFERYGITLEQMLQYRGQTHDEAVEALMPDAERQTKTTLALRELVEHEGLEITGDEIEAEVQRMALDYDESSRENIIQTLRTQMINNVANVVIDRKLRARVIEIATGTAPALKLPADDAATVAPGESTDEVPATESEEQA
ncbi:trigger factor [Chloroflexales bacterium ZM16-3]|nr:trigger factor [Chloroflexales bacterium ZM16-3]